MVFRDLAAQARKHLQAGEFETAATLFGRAIAFWQGPAGEDLPGTRRLVALLNGLNGERTAAIEGLARAAILAGRYSDAVTKLDHHIADHPTHESAWVLLTSAQYLGGNAAIAQATARRAARVLADGVGLDPGADLKAAEEATIRHDDDWFRRYLRNAN